MNKSKNRIGYIVEYDLKLNPHLENKFAELRDKATKWVEWANTAKPEEYDFFATLLGKETENGVD